MTLRTIAVPPAANRVPKGLIILLHGWGANGEDLVGLAEFLDLPDYYLLFPEAPLPHPYNPVGKMWYDLPESYSFLGTPEFGDRPDVSNSRQLLLELIAEQSDRLQIPLSQTILGGFSQGGAMTMDVGVRLPLAGLMVLSGYLHAPLEPQVFPLPPVLMVHGQQDTVVPIAASYQSRDRLQTLGASVNYQEYPAMGHEIQPTVLEKIKTFVKAKLGNVNEP
jgi:phospholipase/carboxylesterase